MKKQSRSDEEEKEDNEFVRLRVERGIRKGRSCDTCGRGSEDREFSCVLLNKGGREERRVYVKSGINCWRPEGVVIVMNEVEE